MENIIIQIVQFILGILILNLIEIKAFTIGFIGSFAYFFTVYIGFAGGKNLKYCRLLLTAFLEKPTWLKLTMIFIYCLLGGFMALFFQLSYGFVFAPIPALIIGITWPGLVASYLTGRQSGISLGEKISRRFGKLPEEYNNKFKDLKYSFERRKK